MRMNRRLNEILMDKLREVLNKQIFKDTVREYHRIDCKEKLCMSVHVHVQTRRDVKSFQCYVNESKNAPQCNTILNIKCYIWLRKRKIHCPHFQYSWCIFQFISPHILSSILNTHWFETEIGIRKYEKENAGKPSCLLDKFSSHKALWTDSNHKQLYNIKPLNVSH